MPDIPNILDTPLSGAGTNLLKTAQTTDFSPAGRTTLDDGGFQIGAAGSKLTASYQILTAGQFSGATNITVNSIVDAHSNECVIDILTTLMWNRIESDNIYGTGTQNLVWNDQINNEDIFEYCDQANISMLAGFNDWRIPNVVELLSLMLYDSTMPSPRFNQTAFPFFSNSFKWTSTTDPSQVARALVINATLGSITASPKISGTISSSLLVRLGLNT